MQRAAGIAGIWRTHEKGRESMDSRPCGFQSMPRASSQRSNPAKTDGLPAGRFSGQAHRLLSRYGQNRQAARQMPAVCFSPCSASAAKRSFGAIARQKRKPCRSSGRSTATEARLRLRPRAAPTACAPAKRTQMKTASTAGSVLAKQRRSASRLRSREANADENGDHRRLYAGKTASLRQRPTPPRNGCASGSRFPPPPLLRQPAARAAPSRFGRRPAARPPAHSAARPAYRPPAETSFQ